MPLKTTLMFRSKKASRTGDISEELAIHFGWRKMEPIACWMITDINVKQMDGCGIFAVVLTVDYASAHQDSQGNNFKPDFFISQQQQLVAKQSATDKFLLAPWVNICLGPYSFKMSSIIIQRKGC